MMRAMGILSEEFDIKYELVGGGKKSFLESEAIKYGVKDKVVFMGQLTHEEIFQWIDGLDFYIQPSMQEGLPRSLIEAMSRACPAIGSTTAGIPELIDSDYIFTRGSVKSLTRVMRKTFSAGLEDIAERNFEKSKVFQMDILRERRELLYKQYLRTVMDKRNDK